MKINTGGLASKKTLQDDFAGQALIGILSNSDTLASIKIMSKKSGESENEIISSICYEIADAIIKKKG